MRKIRTYTAAELIRSTKTKHVQSLLGCDIYNHNISSMAGTFVVLYPDVSGFRDWETFTTFQDAKRAIVQLRP